MVRVEWPFLNKIRDYIKQHGIFTFLVMCIAAVLFLSLTWLLIVIWLLWEGIKRLLGRPPSDPDPFEALKELAPRLSVKR